MVDTPDESSLLGTEIDGRYRLDRFVGAGTMGSVYAGTQLAVGRPVAIKLLNAAMQTNAEVRDRFRVEAQAIATLSHPNCVTLYDFGWSDELGALFMAVEFLDGQSLDRLIGDGMPVPLALSLARQVAEVLTIAHDAGIMHRDLKPENIMVVEATDGSAQAKVLDFGLARIFEDATGSTRLTRQGQLFGTPAYMSPEQCKAAMDVGPPADIYALGVSMFEMLMGRLPFDSPSVPELLILHSTQTAPPVPATDGIPLAVSALISRMLSKAQEERPTASEVVAVLSAVLEGRTAPSLSALIETRQRAAGAGAATVNSTTDLEPVTEPERSAKTPALIVAGLLVLAAGVVGAVALSGDPPEPVMQPTAPVAAKPDNPPPAEEPNELAVAGELAEDTAAAVASNLLENAATIAQDAEEARQLAAQAASSKAKKRKPKVRRPKPFKKLGFSYE